jgi:hypothetical protein
MGVGIDAGRDADEDTSYARPSHALGIVRSVEHDEAARLGCRRELLVRLVVPVQHDRVGGDTGAAGERELAERRGLRAQALVGEEPKHLDVGERLHAVEDGRLRRSVAIRLRASPQRLLAVDDERRAVRLCKRCCRHAAEHELTAFYHGRIGKERQCRHDFDATRR